MLTLKAAVKAEILYPIPIESIEIKLLKRGLNPDSEMIPETFHDQRFLGATADCYIEAADAPNISEAGMSISLQDRQNLRKRALMIYEGIGEEHPEIPSPVVYIIN